MRFRRSPIVLHPMLDRLRGYERVGRTLGRYRWAGCNENRERHRDRREYASHVDLVEQFRKHGGTVEIEGRAPGDGPCLARCAPRPGDFVALTRTLFGFALDQSKKGAGSPRRLSIYSRSADGDRRPLNSSSNVRLLAGARRILAGTFLEHIVGLVGLELDRLVLDDSDVLATGLPLGFVLAARDVHGHLDLDFRM